MQNTMISKCLRNIGKKTSFFSHKNAVRACKMVKLKWIDLILNTLNINPLCPKMHGIVGCFSILVWYMIVIAQQSHFVVFWVSWCAPMMQSGQSSTWALLLWIHAVVIDAVRVWHHLVEILKAFPEKDLIWMGVYVGLKPVYTFQDGLSLSRCCSCLMHPIPSGIRDKGVLITNWMVPLFKGTALSNHFEPCGHRIFFLFAFLHFKYILAQRRWQCFHIMLTFGVFFAWGSFNLQVWIAGWPVRAPLWIYLQVDKLEPWDTVWWHHFPFILIKVSLHTHELECKSHHQSSHTAPCCFDRWLFNLLCIQVTLDKTLNPILPLIC